MEWKELLPGSSLSHLDCGSRFHDLSLVSGFCIVAFTISLVLLRASFICVDVGEPTSRPCSMTGMRQDHHQPILQDFELLGTTMWDLL